MLMSSSQPLLFCMTHVVTHNPRVMRLEVKIYSFGPRLTPLNLPSALCKLRMNPVMSVSLKSSTHSKHHVATAHCLSRDSEHSTPELE